MPNGGERSAADDVARYLDELVGLPGVVYVASGIIDPSRARDEHEKVNYLLPRNVVEGATKLGYRVLTFGTVMETLVGEASNNAYYSSKLELGKFVEQFSAAASSVLHVRIHTLFGGGVPAAFTFLGQMLRALAEQVEFKMSPGEQLRGYHHLDDEVRAIFHLVDTETSTAPSI